ncbi:MAG TPA: serine/threonine protein kinase [Cyanobacteria bacterium UBA8803]|nr:serine/threonine protein kinase [Cyanobacteria bacterium UBA9273]HBL57541.1 serine/threonine protein kinase [Cyanobacteria bacterium UBA8803]
MKPTLLNNRYRVLQTLGAGGFGNTFLAEDTYMPSGRRCVIKQLKPMAQDPQTYKLAQERFHREAAVLEDLGEGNNQIPRLYAYFSEAGQFYLVQEWIEGDTLTKKVEREGKLNDTEVKTILLRLLPVLDYVHSRHMVHRDIKPDNVIIRNQDGLPVLIDFGAVKEAIKTVVNLQTNAPQSMVIGTPGFMPPEQAAGRPVYASDLYGLGVTAVFLLTGKLPQALAIDTRTGEIVWHRDAPNCDSHLAAVVDRAIRIHPSDRFASARDMLNALESHNLPPAPSRVATVAIAPGRLPPPHNPAVPPTVAVPRNRNSPDPGQPLILGGLLGGGLLIAGVAVGLSLNRSLAPASRVTEPPEPASTVPAVESPLSPTYSRLPEPTPTPNSEQVTRQFPKPPLAPDPTPVIPPSPEAPLPPDSTSLIPPSSKPSSTSPPSPTPISVPSPSPSPENNEPAPNLTKGFPAFAPGTSRKTVESALGSPTKASKGLWNTRALVYEDFVPNQVSLGYLFDPSSGRLRQTEASFYNSVEVEAIAKTLDQMLSGNLTPDIQQGLSRVYNRRSNRYRFTINNGTPLKGVIERNEYDRVYIGVWEADLH